MYNIFWMYSFEFIRVIPKNQVNKKDIKIPSKHNLFNYTNQNRKKGAQCECDFSLFQLISSLDKFATFALVMLRHKEIRSCSSQILYCTKYVLFALFLIVLSISTTTVCNVSKRTRRTQKP